MSQPPAGTMAVGQPLIGTMTAGQPQGGMTATMRSMDLVVMWSTLKSQENRKAKKCLSSENRLSQEKTHQKVGIHLILALQSPDRAS